MILVTPEGAPVIDLKKYSFANWVVAYITVQGAFPVQVFTGYMGRWANSECPDETMVLEDAFEFESVLKQIMNPDTREPEIVREFSGSPIEMVKSANRILIRPIAIFQLDMLAPEDLERFAKLRAHVESMKSKIKVGASRIQLPR